MAAHSLPLAVSTMTREEMAEHMQVMANCLTRSATLPLLPTSTLRVMLAPNDPNTTNAFHTQLHHNMILWFRNSARYPLTPQSPYPDLFSHIDLLSSLATGTIQALAFTTHAAQLYFHRIWTLDSPTSAPMAARDVCARFDRVTLRLLHTWFRDLCDTDADGPGLTAVDWNGFHVFNVLLDFTGHAQLGILAQRHADLPTLSGVARRAEKELLQQRTQHWFFPLARRFVYAVHSRMVADWLVPRIAGKVLPEEILEIVKGELFDGVFLGVVEEVVREMEGVE